MLLVTENETYRFDALLYSTGRKPNVEPLQLENTDIELTERGAIKVDKHCQTNVPGVFAVGDVNGGPQFTYISLDDFRVVYSYLAGDGSYTLEDRLNVPNTMFITPALSQVGLTESQAADLKLPYAVKEIPVAAMPRGHVNGDLAELSKLLLILKQKKFLEQASSQKVLKKSSTSSLLLWTTRFLTLTSQNKSSLTQPWLRT